MITGTEDRQHAYVALSRGTDVNLAYVFTTSLKRADPAPGPRPAPEPALYDQIYPERTGARAPVTPLAPPGTALMDARKERIGEHAADHAPPWAIAALGPVPAHPLDRLDWQKRAAAIGAWRELSGHHDPGNPIGPEPVAAAPDLRAVWHEAFAALGPVDGPDVRGMPDGLLCHLRDTYPIETAWAPKWVGDELGQVRGAARDAHLAVAADAELHRRHPGQHYPPLRSAEPEPATGAQRDELIPTPDQPPGEIDQWITDLAAGHRTFADRLADRQSQMIPSEDPDYGDLSPAFPAWTSPGREPILQPPMPEIPPSPQILQRAMDRDADWEAAD